MQIGLQIAANLGGAWIAGGTIGWERSFHGRAAGFRTHCLVAIAAAAAVMVSYIPLLQPQVFPGAASVDGRVAQGVMTGVGFLGAGVIFKEGVNVQGLTTAASVWATAAIGLLFGLGAFLPGTLAAGAVLATLLALRWIELVMPSNVYAWTVLRFRAGDAPSGEAVEALFAAGGLSFGELSVARTQGGTLMEYSGNVRGSKAADVHAMAERLRAVEGLVEFELDRISK